MRQFQLCTLKLIEKHSNHQTPKIWPASPNLNVFHSLITLTYIMISPNCYHKPNLEAQVTYYFSQFSVNLVKSFLDCKPLI